jgi:curved DNA-binding protein CbpA
MTDLYAVLRVAPTASAAELDAAFRTLVRRHHPDTGDGDDERLRQVLDAYAVLRDAAARAAYDRRRTPRRTPARSGTPASPADPPNPGHPANPADPAIRVGPVRWTRP